MNYLKQMREDKKLNENQVAEYIGISKNQYLEYEKSPLLIPTSIAVKISHLFGCNVSEIFLPLYLQNVDCTNQHERKLNHDRLHQKTNRL